MHEAALTDRPLALPQSLNGLPEMAQLGSGVACAVDDPFGERPRDESCCGGVSHGPQAMCVGQSDSAQLTLNFWRTEIPLETPLLEVAVAIVNYRG
jgi:hypothetical protein